MPDDVAMCYYHAMTKDTWGGAWCLECHAERLKLLDPTTPLPVGDAIQLIKVIQQSLYRLELSCGGK